MAVFRPSDAFLSQQIAFIATQGAALRQFDHRHDGPDAAAGARVVANTFATKDLGRLSPAIHSVPAAAPELVAALRAAWKAGPVTAADRRIDLSTLGKPIDRVVERLARMLSEPPKPRRARRAATAKAG